MESTAQPQTYWLQLCSLSDPMTQTPNLDVTGSERTVSNAEETEAVSNSHPTLPWHQHGQENPVVTQSPPGLPTRESRQTVPRAWNLCTDAWCGMTRGMGFTKITSPGNPKYLMGTHLCGWGGSARAHSQVNPASLSLQL